MIPYPQLHDLAEYAAAGAAIDAVADSPSTGTPGSYIKIVSIAGGAVLEVITAAGNTRALTVVANAEYRLDFTDITENTTCGPVQVGWSA